MVDTDEVVGEQPAPTVDVTKSGSLPEPTEDGGDPSLDIDDREGFGPENINIDVAVPGEYLVGVDYFTPEGTPIGNTIRIYLYGQLYAEFYRELVPNEFWEVAIINWPEACVEDLSTTASECD